MTAVAIERFGPTRPWSRAGSTIDAQVALRATRPVAIDLVVELIDGIEVVDRATLEVELLPGRHSVALPVRLPDRRRRGYGLRLSVHGTGRTLVRASAVEALDGWWDAPRHAALIRFERAGAATRVTALRDWHVTVTQAYDWMWRHYRFRAPTEPFTDALGRRVSHDAVRAAVAAGHDVGLAALAYGAVYGAEPEYVANHPDEVLRDEAGAPLGLGGTFHIMDIRPGTPWRRRLLEEYEDACRGFDFDGIHMDTYGPPYRGIAADGAAVELDRVYPGLIAEADARVRATDPRRRVLFNCVEGWPLAAVADAPAAALYLELWPPDDRFSDLVRWIDEARRLAAGRAVVIAAYGAAMKDPPTEPAARVRAFEATLLTTVVITAAGAFHHTLAEAGRLLVEGYYPAAVVMRRGEATALRTAWRFGARALHLVSAADARPLAVDDLELRTSDGALAPMSHVPSAGKVWVRATSTDAGPVVQLIDLRGQTDDRWTEPRDVGPASDGWTLRWPAASAPIAGSPWTARGEFAALRLGRERGTWRLPAFRRWLVVNDPLTSPAGPR